jgi:hypothetical protein
MSIEITGPWEELVSRPEFRGHQVRVTVVDEPASPSGSDDWLEALQSMARGGVRIARPADDSRESIFLP